MYHYIYYKATQGSLPEDSTIPGYLSTTCPSSEATTLVSLHPTKGLMGPFVPILILTWGCFGLISVMVCQDVLVRFQGWVIWAHFFGGVFWSISFYTVLIGNIKFSGWSN